MEIRMLVSGETTKEREQDIRDSVDKALSMIRGITKKSIELLPSNNRDGRSIKRMDPTKMVSFNRKNKKPKFDLYTNGWVARPSDWSHQNVELHFATELAPMDLYHSACLKLLNEGMELKPKAMRLTANNSPAGMLVRSTKSIDLSLIHI